LHTLMLGGEIAGLPAELSARPQAGVLFPTRLHTSRGGRLLEPGPPRAIVADGAQESSPSPRPCCAAALLCLAVPPTPAVFQQCFMLYGVDPGTRQGPASVPTATPAAAGPKAGSLTPDSDSAA
jgi:hypothetical protein